MTVSTSSLVVGLFSILGLQQVQVVGVADSLHDREYLHYTLKLSTIFSRYFHNMRRIEGAFSWLKVTTTTFILLRIY